MSDTATTAAQRADAEQTLRRPGRPRRTVAQREAHRRKLVTAVMDAVRRHGPDLSVGEMATVAGVSKPVLYSVFGDKQGIAEAVAETMGDAVESRIRSELSRSRRGDVDQVVATLIDSIVDLVEEEPELHQFFVRSIRTGDRSLLDNPLARVVHRRISPLMEALEPMMDPAERAVLTDGAFGFLFTAVDSWLASGGVGHDRLVEVLTAAARGGLRAAATR